MQQLWRAVIYLSLCLSFSKLSCSGADDAIAQSNIEAAAAAASVELSAEASNAAPFFNQRLKRRYIPRFIGKRKQDSNGNTIEKIISEEIYPDLENESTEIDEDKLLELIDKYDEKEFIDDVEGLPHEDEIEDFDNDEYLDDENNTSDESIDIERRRYIPSFIGKRYNPMFVGKRYNPMFVGKKYSPMFVGKRYIPRFIGKRYIPRFIGKRYRPMFIGKRGSRSPMFIGKRYNPMFVGKRYKPMFIGKKATTIPRFIGKRSSPVLLGERRVPMFLGKRSVSDDEQLQASGKDIAQDKPHSRKKRSIMIEDDNDVKRAWGTYVPWQDMPTYNMLQSAAPETKKRFVAPEFIGRRDSLSSLLSALKALRYARNEPRVASKRFQAPLFIGKRDDGESEDALLKYYRLSPLRDGNYELISALQEMSGKVE